MTEDNVVQLADLVGAAKEADENALPRRDGDLAALLDDTCLFIGRFVVTGVAEIRTMALWVAHCHALDAADYTPYIELRSPEKRCGKSRVQDVLSLLVPSAEKTASISPAVLYRLAAES